MAVTQSLSVTEVSGSINTSANTSKVRILWKSTQTGDSWNGYTRTAKYYVSINGGAEKEYVVSYTLPQNSTNTIVDTTLTITHKSDGSGSVKVRTWMDTRINAGEIEQTKTLTLTKITKPTVKMTLSPVTPYDKFASLYLQGRSKVKATFTSDGEGLSYKMQAEGKSYSSPYTSDLLRTSGKVAVTGTVTDSSGFSYSIPGEISVIAYDAPYIAPYEGYKKVICERCTEDGTASDTGTYLHVKGTRNYTKINTGGVVNTCSVRCRYKPEGGSWSHEDGDGVGVLLWTDTSTDSFDVILPDIVTDTTLFYAVELNIIDDTYLPSTMTFSIPSEAVDFHLREDGKGAAFGKYATKERVFECEWDARFNNKLYHQEHELNVVIEQGTKSINTAEGTAILWHYRKWLDGSAECWCRRNVDVNISYPWGTALYYGVTTTINYPFAFVERPITQITCEYGDDEASLFIASCGSGTNVYATPVMLCRTDSKTVNCNVLYHAHGRWK